MARLNVPPKSAATPKQNRPPVLPSLSSNSSDAEAASQQLLTEAASATKMPRSAAVDGANLLNAARVQPANTVPRKKKDGKLSRPSLLVTGELRTNLAPRGNLYDVLSSPEKDRSSIPDKVNRKPIKVVKKAKKTTPSTHVSAVDQASIVETHSSGNSRCTAVDWKYNKGKDSRYRQCSQPGLHDSDAGPRCKTHISRPPILRCEHVTTKDTQRKQCSKPASNEPGQEPRCTEHAEQPESVTHRSQPEVRIPVRSRTKAARSTTAVAEDASRIAHDDDDRPTLAEPPLQGTQTGKHKGGKAQILKGKPSESRKLSTAKEKTEATATASDISQSNAKKLKAKKISTGSTENEALDLDVNDTDGDQPEIVQGANEEGDQHDINDVFKYLTLKECSGRCETKSGADILQACEVSQLLVQADDTSTNTIADDIEVIRRDLNRTLADVSKEDRPVFKGDAYAYIFRALTAYLQAVYIWLDNQHDEATDSLDALRKLSTLSQVVLTLKDTISSWKVSAPPRSDGQMIIKVVDSKLIVPLRKVHDTFRKQLRLLEDQTDRSKRHAELKRKRAEEAEEERRRADDEVDKVERWKRWQNLHVLRMQLEPDPFRRRKRLMIQNAGALEERDANGVRFERVPIFKVRSSLVRHWIAIAHDDREWTDAETEALIQGLNDFAGPRVFEKILKEYCHAPDGLLRDFSVSSIFAKAAWLHSQSVALSQEREDWEMPAYLADLPNVLAMYPSPSLKY